MEPRRELPLAKKLTFGLLTTVLVYGLLEFVLWGCGVRTIESVRDPFVGFEPGVPLFVRDGDNFVTNPLRTANFNVQQFSAVKKAGTIRIFCLGGSTTFGHPYDARVAYPHCLATRLSHLAPGKRFEVVNCGGVSYASYRLALLADELVAYEPDILVIHTGHNEFLEDRTYGEIRDRPQWINSLVGIGSRLRSVALLSRCLEPANPQTRVPELSADVKTILESSNGPQSYSRNDKLHQQILQHLDFTLRRMQATAKHAGAKVIFVRPACDLRGISPFKSEYAVQVTAQHAHQALLKQAHIEQEAGRVETGMKLLADAVRLDPRHAEGQWLYGHALLAAGKFPEARGAFLSARDEDVCPLRATSDIEALVEKVARDTDSTLVNLTRHLESACQATYGHQCLGPESFLDHVHLTPERHVELAVRLSEALQGMNVIDNGQRLDGPTERRWREALAAEVPPDEQALALHTLSMTLGWTGKNEEALRLAERAVELAPKEARVRAGLGRLLQKLGDLPTALQSYQAAVALDGENALALYRLGSLLQDMGRHAEGRAILERALRCTPSNAPESFRIGLMERLRRPNL